MKASLNPKDIERYDTLCDVNISCTAAVDILNDLLCYEKLESGILKLHKEDVAVSTFLQDSVSMFAAQARECGVTMSIIPSDKGEFVSSNDSIFVDKFKMDQVIRNLISNALKFTPRGGTMTLHASFVPNIDNVSDMATSSLGAVRTSWSSCLKGIGNTCCCKTRRKSAHYAHSHISRSPHGECTDGRLVIVVTDSGAGISAENQKRLFRDIVQFNPERLQAGGGSGLGLWITGGIVDLHGGKIRVFSEGEGMGCSFTVEIPMTRSRSVALQQLTQSSNDTNEVYFIELQSPISNKLEKVGESPSMGFQSELDSGPLVIAPSVGHSSKPQPQSGERQSDVLVVDDSRLNRKMLLKCLRTDGHISIEAEDGLQAIERVKERMNGSDGSNCKPFDAILMDFVMPNMDGPTATRQIRSLGYTGIIFGVTGNGKSK